MYSKTIILYLYQFNLFIHLNPVIDIFIFQIENKNVFNFHN